MGKLFVIEGNDSSGKQTQLEKLKNRFEKENIKYKSVSFPIEFVFHLNQFPLLQITFPSHFLLSYI